MLDTRYLFWKTKKFKKRIFCNVKSVTETLKYLHWFTPHKYSSEWMLTLCRHIKNILRLTFTHEIQDETFPSVLKGNHYLFLLFLDLFLSAKVYVCNVLYCLFLCVCMFACVSEKSVVLAVALLVFLRAGLCDVWFETENHSNLKIYSLQAWARLTRLSQRKIQSQTIYILSILLLKPGPSSTENIRFMWWGRPASSSVL